MALQLMHAIVMCELVLRLRSSRMNRGIAHKVEISVPSDVIVVDDEKFLACVVGDSKDTEKPKDRIIIQPEDKPFWDYFYTKEGYYKGYLENRTKTHSLNCKNYTAPPKPFSALRNLTTPSLGEDMIELVASFAVSTTVHCTSCNTVIFKPEFLDLCNASGIGFPPSKEQQEELRKVEIKVLEEGGWCEAGDAIDHAGYTLQSCMRLGPQEALQEAVQYNEEVEDARGFTQCSMQSENQIQKFINKKVEQLFALQKVIDEHKQDDRNVARWRAQLLGLLKVIDEHKQVLVYIKHVFEGL